MTPVEAKEWGVIDAIVEHTPRNASPNGHTGAQLTQLK
jgi:hypothetical protein